MSNTVKRKSVKTDTAIKVIAIGILGYIGLKTIPSLASGLGGYGGSGGSGGYMGSGTDLSSIPAGFFTETPPVFNITNTPPDSFFSTPNIIDESGNTISTETTKKEFTTRRIPDMKITDMKIPEVFKIPEQNNFNIFNPKSWIRVNPNNNNSGGILNIIKPISDDKPLVTGLIFPSIANNRAILWNASVNAFGFIIDTYKNLNGSGGSGGGCSSGKCGYSTEDVFTVDLGTTKKSTTINQSSNFNTAEDFLKSLRNNVQDRSITYSNPRYSSNSEASLAYATKIQNQLANSLASGNCGNAISTNACSGTKKETNYATAQSSGTRYYENTIANTKKELIRVEMG